MAKRKSKWQRNDRITLTMKGLQKSSIEKCGEATKEGSPNKNNNPLWLRVQSRLPKV